MDSKKEDREIYEISGRFYTRASRFFRRRYEVMNRKLGLQKSYYDLPNGKRGYRWEKAPEYVPGSEADRENQF